MCLSHVHHVSIKRAVISTTAVLRTLRRMLLQWQWNRCAESDPMAEHSDGALSGIILVEYGTEKDKQHCCIVPKQVTVAQHDYCKQNWQSETKMFL